MKGKIAEVFNSIQGEGIYLGERQLFVRFFGCNLSCNFCDTQLDAFLEYEPYELFEELQLYQGPYHSISFTGGEPLLQKDFLKETLQLTHNNGFRNYLETNGTLPDALREVISYLDIVAMDIKLPSSTGAGPLWEAHRKFLDIASRKEVFLKATICRSTKTEDLQEAVSLIKEVNRSAILVLQPNSSEKDMELIGKLEDFRDICRSQKVAVCIIPQMHRIMGIE